MPCTGTLRRGQRQRDTPGPDAQLQRPARARPARPAGPPRVPRPPGANRSAVDSSYRRRDAARRSNRPDPPPAGRYPRPRPAPHLGFAGSGREMGSRRAARPTYRVGGGSGCHWVRRQSCKLTGYASAPDGRSFQPDAADPRGTFRDSNGGYAVLSTGQVSVAMANRLVPIEPVNARLLRPNSPPRTERTWPSRGSTACRAGPRSRNPSPRWGCPAGPGRTAGPRRAAAIPCRRPEGQRGRVGPAVPVEPGGRRAARPDGDLQAGRRPRAGPWAADRVEIGLLAGAAGWQPRGTGRTPVTPAERKEGDQC